MLIVGWGLGVGAEWVPGEASVTVFESGSLRHYQWELNSSFSNAHRNVVLKCWGRCDYIPQIFQCSGNRTLQHCRIETRPGYELKSIILEFDTQLESEIPLRFDGESKFSVNSQLESEIPLRFDGESKFSVNSQLELHYFMRRNASNGIHNCDPNYFNWVERTSMQIYGLAHVVVVVAGLLCGFGYFQHRPIQEYSLISFGFLCLFGAIAGLYHLSTICTSISTS